MVDKRYEIFVLRVHFKPSVFLNTLRNEQQCRQGENYLNTNLIDLSNLTVNVNAILTEFILEFRKQPQSSSRQIESEKVTNRSIFSSEKV